MDKNEVKKRLYKENPGAILLEVRADGMLYQALFKGDDGLPDINQKVKFLVPLGEIGEVVWNRIMDAKLLIRWLQD